MADNLTLLQYTVNRLQDMLTDEGYAFLVEGAITAGGGLVIRATHMEDPLVAFPIVWMYDFSQEDFEATMAQALALGSSLAEPAEASEATSEAISEATSEATSPLLALAVERVEALRLELEALDASEVRDAPVLVQ